MDGEIMLFDIKELEFSIIDVLKISRNELADSPIICHGRPFSVLSCRLSGSSEINIDGKLFKPRPNNYFLCPAYTKYTQIYHTEEIIAIHLNFTNNAPRETELVTCMLPEVRDNFIKLYTCWSQKKPGYIYKCKSITYNILYLLCNSNQIADDSKIKDSMEYLYSNFIKKDFSIEKMISCSYFSQAHFRRIFYRQYGYTIVDFVNRLRIEYAKSLMESNEYSLKEIAVMSGFNDEKYFSQVFKKITGYTPTQYY